MNYDTMLTDAQLTRMLEPIAPDWQLRDATPVETGHHAVDAVDAFGFLTYDGPPLSGGVPAGDFPSVAVVEPTPGWRERLDGWAQDTLPDIEDTRFADVIPEVRPVLTSQVDAVEGPFEPALARVDQSIENVLVADGELTAWIDWEFTIAATPAYDLCCVAWSLAGGPYQSDPDVPDRRPLVREALFEGYADAPVHGERSPAAIVEQARANRACYELLSTLRSMEHIEGWFELFDLGDQVDRAARDLRAELADRL